MLDHPIAPMAGFIILLVAIYTMFDSLNGADPYTAEGVNYKKDYPFAFFSNMHNCIKGCGKGYIVCKRECGNIANCLNICTRSHSACLSGIYSC